MSYMEPRRTAPFGAITIYRAGSALNDAFDLIFGGRRRTSLGRFSPAELEDLGLSVADLPAEPRTGLLDKVAGVFRGWNARRRTLAELGRLNDAQLDDIGLTRWDVEELSAGRVTF
jgi:uncharacterized protein YjiS (DUF1127 family)